MDLVFVYISSWGKGIVNMFTILTSRTNRLQKHLVSVLGQSNLSGKPDNIIMLLLCVSWYNALGMWWHTVTHGRGSEGETGEWSR